MKKSIKLSDEKLSAIEEQIQKESVPYIYDTKEYPVEVIVAKYEKEQIFVPHYQRNFVWKLDEKSRFMSRYFSVSQLCHSWFPCQAKMRNWKL